MKMFLVFITMAGPFPTVQSVAWVPDLKTCKIVASTLNKESVEAKRGTFNCMKLPSVEHPAIGHLTNE